jgi:hypothetical protein
MAPRHVVDQVLHPQQRVSPISHRGVILHSIPKKHAEARSANQIAVDSAGSLETAAGFSQETVVGTVTAKSVPCRHLAWIGVLNLLETRNLRKNTRIVENRASRTIRCKGYTVQAHGCTVMNQSGNRLRERGKWQGAPFHGLIQALD